MRSGDADGRCAERCRRTAPLGRLARDCRNRLMENIRKKDLIREYKEQKATPGIFAVRCGDQVWVGPSKNLEKQQNSIWFQLRQNGHLNKAMQAAWNTHGANAFVFEVLE